MIGNWIPFGLVCLFMRFGSRKPTDFNAACNIATWGYVSTHERWDILSCSLHDDLSTSKANAL